MKNDNYNATIMVGQSASIAFKSINSVTKWWSENLIGDTENLNDVFTIDWGGGNFVAFKLIEVISNKKVVWLVTDCNLNWLQHKKEWKNTKMDFEITSLNNKTQIHFTHIGLVPEVECYDNCVKGWDQYFKGSLFKLITEGAGQPQLKNNMK